MSSESGSSSADLDDEDLEGLSPELAEERALMTETQEEKAERKEREKRNREERVEKNKIERIEKEEKERVDRAAKEKRALLTQVAYRILIKRYGWNLPQMKPDESTIYIRKLYLEHLLETIPKG